MIELRFPIGYGTTLLVRWDADRAAGALKEMVNRFHPRQREYLEAVGRIMRRSYAENFRSGGRPAWKPLAPSTVAQKRGMMTRGLLPPLTRSGRIPRRLLQVSRDTGAPSLNAFTILIRYGTLRDSWVVKGAKGNVSEIEDGTAFFGSQLTIQHTLRPQDEQKHYHIVTKKAAAARKRGQSVTVMIPLARIQEQGAPRANIPPRRVAVLQEDDVRDIRALSLRWLRGEPL